MHRALYITCKKVTLRRLTIKYSNGCNRLTSLKIHNSFQPKVSRVLHFLMITGRLFHKVAAAFLKHLLPYVTPRVVGTAKNAPGSDRNYLVGWYGMTSSIKYWGAVPWSALKVYIKILYCDLYITGSQARSSRLMLYVLFYECEWLTWQKNDVLFLLPCH